MNLNINLYSFDFLSSIINSKDTIRVSITVIPEMAKKSYTFDVNRTDSSVAFFSIKLTEQTKRILIAFQKTGQGKVDKLIASTIFPAEEFYKLLSFEKNTAIQKINVYEAFQQMHKNNLYKKDRISKRKVIGTMVGHFQLKNREGQIFNINKENMKNNIIYDEMDVLSLKNNDHFVVQNIISN